MPYFIGGRGSLKGLNNKITGTNDADKILGDNYTLGNDPTLFPTYGGTPFETGVVHDTDTSPFPATAVTPVGAAGTVASGQTDGDAHSGSDAVPYAKP